MRVAISLQAEAEIADITDFIAIESSRAANQLNARLYDACYGLVAHPERFEIASDIGAGDVRRCPINRYSIFYIVRTEDVLVLRVVHSARKYSKLFRD